MASAQNCPSRLGAQPRSFSNNARTSIRTGNPRSRVGAVNTGLTIPAGSMRMAVGQESTHLTYQNFLLLLVEYEAAVSRVVQFHHSPLLHFLLEAINLFPRVCLAVVGGAAADRLRRGHYRIGRKPLPQVLLRQQPRSRRLEIGLPYSRHHHRRSGSEQITPPFPFACDQRLVCRHLVEVGLRAPK